MSNAKHTPGPQDKAAKLSLHLQADSGYSAKQECRVSAEQWGRICQIAEGRMTTLESELLDALEATMKYVPINAGATYKKARAAIAKAKGE